MLFGKAVLRSEVFFLKGKFCLHNGDRTSREQYAVSFHLASDVAATPGNLGGGQDVLAKFIGPVRSKFTMSGACDRVFGDAQLRCEEAADKINISAGRSDDDPTQIKLPKENLVGRDGANGCFAIKYGQVIVRGQYLNRVLTESFGQDLWNLAWCWRARREVHFQPRSLLFHEQITTPCFKADDLFGVAKNFEDNMGCCQSSVAAEINFLDRGEPT